MSLAGTFYRAVFRRTSTFVLAIVGGAFLFERSFDQGSEWLFRYLNQGKLYADVKHKFVKSEE